MLPFGGFFLKLIGGELIKAVFNQAVNGQVPTTVVTPTGVEVGLKPWYRTKSMWGAMAVVGYIAFDLITGTPLNVTDINSILTNGDDIFLLAASILTAIGRKRV